MNTSAKKRQQSYQGITINGEGMEVYIEREVLKEIKEVFLSENKVSLYHSPQKGKGGWSPYRGRASKVRAITLPEEK